jgi:hypothetical protein
VLSTQSNIAEHHRRVVVTGVGGDQHTREPDLAPEARPELFVLRRLQHQLHIRYARHRWLFAVGGVFGDANRPIKMQNEIGFRLIAACDAVVIRNNLPVT